ncbi:photosystem I reaction center subunit XI, partial [Acinetobacter baumannii]|uniref:photosystem I reaction center subunit XI n=1 Tax=Acinetobacter baumannii TaxID=470 RepID=UPI001BB4673E
AGAAIAAAPQVLRSAKSTLGKHRVVTSTFFGQDLKGLIALAPINNKAQKLAAGSPSRFTVKATLQTDKPTFQVIEPLNGDPFIGSLETPVTSSPLVAWYLSNLPAYRTAVSP